MQYIETSNKSVQEIVNAIKEIASKYSFGVQHIYNLQETLQNKGKNLDEECQIVDICNPNFAETFLNEDISLSCILPCKIAVYTKDKQTHIVLNSLAQLVDDINPDLTDIAIEVQEQLLAIIDEVK
ncbi:DUF302 domain-containing protein [Aliarcobacter vitoriensis]|uniref:DUF302 domain-containing protein n=1 Tax=Aliarcobacter vitoriensis TaxID=2011099 RepID=UPI003AAC7D37